MLFQDHHFLVLVLTFSLVLLFLGNTLYYLLQPGTIVVIGSLCGVATSHSVLEAGANPIFTTDPATGLATVTMGPNLEVKPGRRVSMTYKLNDCCMYGSVKNQLETEDRWESMEQLEDVHLVDGTGEDIRLSVNPAAIGQRQMHEAAYQTLGKNFLVLIISIQTCSRRHIH